MSDRDKRLQSIGSLLGRAAGHGVLYGMAQRETILYVNEARDKLRSLGKLHKGDEDVIKGRAALTGADTIDEAFKEKKRALPPSADAAKALLPQEIDRCWRKL